MKEQTTFPNVRRETERRRIPVQRRPEQLLAPGLTPDMLPPLPLANRAPRRIVTRSGHRVRGLNIGSLYSTALAWESPLEASALVILSLCRSVQHIFTQPCVLQVGEMQYTPDLLVFLRNGNRIWIECKPDARRLDSDTAQKLGLVNALLQGVGDRFVILDEQLLAEDSPVIDNCRYLLRWLDLTITTVPKSLKKATYGELIDQFGPDRVNTAPRRPPKVLHLWPPKLLHPGQGDLTH